MNNEMPIQLEPSANTESAALSTLTNRRRRGFVARLPKTFRDKINQMLDDGFTYADIAAELQKPSDTPLPHPVSEDHIKTWKAGGYQDYLRNQTWADAVRGTQEKVLEAAAEDPVKFADAGVQLAATGICELLAELSRLQSSDEKASDRYARIANAMARLARVILTYEQHRQAVAKEKAAELPQRDPNKPFGDESDHLAVVRVVDKVLGIDRYRKLMMEQDAAAGRPWPSQTQSSATSNVALANSADAAPVSIQSSETSQISYMGTGTSGLKSEIPSSGDDQPLEPAPTPQVSPEQSREQREQLMEQERNQRL